MPRKPKEKQLAILRTEADYHLQAMADGLKRIEALEDGVELLAKLQEQLLVEMKKGEYERSIREAGKKIVETIVEVKHESEGIEDDEIVEVSIALLNQLESKGEYFLLKIKEIRSLCEQEQLMQEVNQYFSEKNLEIDHLIKLSRRHTLTWLSSTLKAETQDFSQRLSNNARRLRKIIEDLKAFELIANIDEIILYIGDGEVRLSIEYTQLDRNFETLVLGDKQDMMIEAKRLIDLLGDYVDKAIDQSNQITDKVESLVDAKNKRLRRLLQISYSFLVIATVFEFVISNLDQGLVSSDIIKQITWLILGTFSVAASFCLVFALLVSFPRFGGGEKRGIYSTKGGEYGQATKDLYARI